MTQWFGRFSTTVKMTGPLGGRVTVGRYSLPKHVFAHLDGDNGHPDLHLHLAWRDGRPEVVEVSIKSKPDGRGVRTSDLEVLALDGLAKSIYKSVAMEFEVEQGGATAFSPVDPDDFDSRGAWELDRDLTEAIASRRGGANRAMLAKVAEIYQQHDGRHALPRIAAALGVSDRTAARRVNEARAAGLLPARSAK